MALFDTIKEDREKLKGKSFKEKAGYFFDYYKWPVIVVVALAVWIGGTVWQKVTAPDICLSGVLFNTSDLLAEDKIQGIIDGFSREQEMEPGKETILLHTDLTYFEGEDFTAQNYESIQVLSAWILAGEVDFIIADQALLERLGANGYLLELSGLHHDREPISPYLLDVSGSPVLREIYGELADSLTLGITVSTEKTDTILAFLDYLEI